mgnify:CR=1 FL=1
MGLRGLVELIADRVPYAQRPAASHTVRNSGQARSEHKTGGRRQVAGSGNDACGTWYCSSVC